MGLLEAHSALGGKYAAVIGGSGGIVGRAVTLALAKRDRYQAQLRVLFPRELT